MHAIAHWVYRHRQRVCVEKLTLGENPLPYQEIKPVPAVCQSNTRPTELVSPVLDSVILHWSDGRGIQLEENKCSINFFSGHFLIFGLCLQKQIGCGYIWDIFEDSTVPPV